MEFKNIVFILVYIASFGFLAYSLMLKIKTLKVGKPENRFDNISERIKNVLVIAFGQSKLLRYKIAGTVHFFIFWGFMLFVFAVIESILQGFYTPFSLSFLGPVFTIITFTQDAFGVLVFAAILISLFRRFVLNIKRLEVSGAGKIDAATILILILFVVITMFGQNCSAIAINGFQFSEGEYRPVSQYLSTVFYSSDSLSLAATMNQIFWWGHILIIFSFMNFLPYSKHFHVITSVPNVYLGKTGNRKYALQKLNLEEETDIFGVADIDHFSWKHLLDGYSCTECGRCTAACPANGTGKMLSPRKIIVDIRHRTEEKAPLIINKIENDEILNKTLIHNYISDAELWACTTCGACVQECPVMIEHVDAIVDLRRNLVLSESEFPNEMNSLFKNLENNFSPWAFNPQDRANWAEGLNVKTMAEDNNTEYLFWVGCSGSFDARYQKVSVAFTKIMQKADINFRILGEEEKCNGDTARRLGNEYLAQMMMQENVEILNNYNVKKIVTACPHCYNSLKNEYPDFGGNFEVIHHSELINQLITDKRIELKNDSVQQKVTYHDSCYLGRYNEIYSDPRNALTAVKGIDLIEMERNMDRGFCCGAGGGRMFLEELEGERINVNRTKEAVNTGANTIASACPFCMTMLSDGLKTLDKNEEIEVKDIAEIVFENLK
ncbi:MAG: heterodisulfide reductase-related iron-sulfur binding cluster [bacterium]